MPSALLAPPAARRVVTAATRRDFLVLLGAAGLLTACGTSDPGAATPTDGYPRTVTTPDDGAVVLDRAPERIGAVGGGRVIPFLLPFLSERVQLVGYGGDASPRSHPWIAAQLAGLANSPDLDGPTLEAYAGWTADLLVANGNLGDYWEPVRAVGPLVQLPETDWRATVRLLGEVFGDPGTAERTVAETEALIGGARLARPVTAAVLSRYQDNGTVGFQVPGAELPNFLADLGIGVAASDTAVDGYEDVSLEVLPERLDVDHVIVLSFGDELQASLLTDPLFTAVPAVAAGRVLTLTAEQTTAAFPVTPPTVPLLLDALAPILGA